MLEAGSLTADFVRRFQATFGERALEIAEAQRDAAESDAARTRWGHIAEVLKGETRSN